MPCSKPRTRLKGFSADRLQPGAAWGDALRDADNAPLGAISALETLDTSSAMARDFAAEQIAPNADKWDEEHYFPYEEVVKPMGELGFFGTVIPEQYGGNEMGWLARFFNHPIWPF